MIKRTAYKIVSKAFDKVMYGIHNNIENPYKFLYEPKVKIALVKYFEYINRSELMQDKFNSMLKNFKLPIPHYRNRIYSKSLQDLMSVHYKVEDIECEEYGRIITTLSHVSDRWASLNRIALIIWVINNYTATELYTVRFNRDDPSRKITKPASKFVLPLSPKIDESAYIPTLSETFKANKEIFVKYFKSKIIKYSKRSAINWHKNKNDIYLADINVRSYHIRVFNADFDMDINLFKSKGSLLGSLKGYWEIDRGTSRFRK